jgi:2,3-bisphosphoglycerate-independent phosphoglycerate mutase
MKKTSLIILDGWGHGNKTISNAIFNAHTPTIDKLYKTSLNTELRTDGECVGLPKGQMGNSEVGHLNIGAGRVVFQDLLKINNDIENGQFNTNETLLEAINTCNKKDRALHIMGLLSDGGIHSHSSHLKALCDTALKNKVKHIFVHAFTDGRDSDPKAGKKYIDDFLDYAKDKQISIATIIGRYYSMDRDKRWDRTTLAYNMLVHGQGNKTMNPIKAIEDSYSNNISDEFILPIVVVDKDDKPITKLQSEDILICFNFRSDRCRQIVTALTQVDIPQYQTNSLDIDIYTMTNYDETFEDVSVLYPKKNIKNTIGEIVSNAGLTQLRIAETEKYPHVTFFFSGGEEKEFKGEYRVMVPSPKVATYDLKPEMSAQQVTEKYIHEIKTKHPDFICLNYANPDMVGHTGDLNAVVKALETIDNCVEKIIDTSIKEDYTLVIIADHGNAELMMNNDGTPHTAHTTNKVPCFIINSDYQSITPGSLCDIAPTILKIMGISIPIEMTGKSIVS